MNSLLRFFLVALFLLLSVIPDVIVSELVQKLMSPIGNEAGTGAIYSKPFLLVYVAGCCYTLFLVPFLIWMCIWNGERWNDLDFRMQFRRFTKGAFACCFLYAAAGYFWFLSLPHISVTAVSLINNTIGAVVYIMSIVVLHETITFWKVVGILVSGGGVVLAALGDHAKPEKGVDGSAIGYVYMLGCVFCWALYAVLYAWLVESDDEDDSDKGSDKDKDKNNHGDGKLSNDNNTIQNNQNLEGSIHFSSNSIPVLKGDSRQINGGHLLLPDEDIDQRTDDDNSTGWVEELMLSIYFLGIMGVFSAILLWPILLILHFTGYEVLEPMTPYVAEIVFSVSALDMTLTAAFLVGICLSNATIMSVGQLLSLPFSYIADLILHDIKLHLYAAIGGGLVIVGFFLVSITWEDVVTVWYDLRSCGGDGGDMHAEEDERSPLHPNKQQTITPKNVRRKLLADKRKQQLNAAMLLKDPRSRRKQLLKITGARAR